MTHGNSPGADGLSGSAVDPSKTASRDRRVYALWGAAFALLALLGAFCWFLVRPYLQVRAAVERLVSGGAREPSAVDMLGGPEAAVRKCSLYLRCPEWLTGKAEKRLTFVILEGCGKPAFPLVEELLDSDDPLLRKEALVALSDLEHPRAAELLIIALKDPDPRVRQTIVSELGMLEDPRSIVPLTDALGDSDAFVRKSAAWALRFADDPRAARALCSALRDPDILVRRCAIQALFDKTGAGVYEASIAALGDSDEEVRRDAAMALGKLQDPRAVASLEAALSDEDESVRSAAAEALAKIRGGEVRR